jgi:hypothetical protein
MDRIPQFQPGERDNGRFEHYCSGQAIIFRFPCLNPVRFPMLLVLSCRGVLSSRCASPIPQQQQGNVDGDDRER